MTHLRSIAAFGGIACAAGLIGLGHTPAQAQTTRLGLQDDRIIHDHVNPARRIQLARSINAKVIRVDLRWDLVATRRPSNARNHRDPAYDWARYDRITAAARRHRIQVIFTIWGTPSWAADPRVPVSPNYPAFGRRPHRAVDVGQFARAAATRYRPRGVRMWEAWNEPNIPLFWQPQFRKVKGRWVPDSPVRYTQVLRQIYRNVKAVDPKARVSGGVTAPNGDANPTSFSDPRYARITPQEFMRLLSRPRLRPPMDAYSHHAYPNRAPSNRINPRASYIDLYSLPVLIRQMDNTYLRGKPVWVTEFGIATRRVPQYPFFRTQAQQVHGLRDAVRRVRNNRRVPIFVWYLMQDHKEWASGLFNQNGTRKPAANHFRALAGR